MWVALIRNEFGVVIFGPWTDVKEATDWMTANFSGRNGMSVVITQLKDPNTIDKDKPLVI